MSTKMQRLFSLMMAVLMMLSLTACGGNATSSTPASVSGSGSESGGASLGSGETPGRTKRAEYYVRGREFRGIHAKNLC